MDKRIAKSVNIKGQKYKILPFDGKGNHYGMCNVKDKEILIDASFSKEDQLKAFLHEVLHAACHECALDQVISAEMEELICENVSNVYYDLFWKKPKKSPRRTRA